MDESVERKIDRDSNSLTAVKLIKIYKKRQVVRGVSFNIRRGEIVGLLGPNGAGKTTSFYMIVGLVKANGGRIYLDDQDITTLPMFERSRLGIGYLAQEPSIFRRLSVEDNITSILEIIGYNQEQIESERERLLRELDIVKIRKSKGIHLSGGERRRTEIARALASRPNFLLLDEPFTGIDPIAVQEIQRIIVDLKRRHIGILITDHNARETLHITDRAYIMADGMIINEGSSEDLAKSDLAKEKYFGKNFSL